MILRGIVHVISCFPLHFILYRGNLDCFSNSALCTYKYWFIRIYIDLITLIIIVNKLSCAVCILNLVSSNLSIVCFYSVCLFLFHVTTGYIFPSLFCLKNRFPLKRIQFALFGQKNSPFTIKK